MKLTKCPNKHFYDAEKYAECPHCHEAASSPPPGPTRRSVAPPQTNDKVPVSGKRSRKKNMEDSGDSHTVPLGQQAEIDAAQPEPAPKRSVHTGEPQAAQELPPDEDTARNDEQEPAEPQVLPLKAAVAAVAPKGSDTEDVKTMAFYDLGGDQEPVVGWLVCVKGSYFGQSFNLKTGRNNVGRAGSMDVVLAQEPSVSRNRHAVITYEPENRDFFIQPGESGGLTYLNKQVVMQFSPMQAYDKIRLGNAEFVFVPCCGENFTWDDHVSQTNM